MAKKNVDPRVRRFLFDLVSSPLLARPLRTDIDIESNPFVIAGFFQTASGMGKLAQMAVTNFQSKGYAPLCVDLSSIFNQVDMVSPIPLSKMPRTNAGTLILCANAPEVRRAMWKLGLHRFKQWHIIGFWAWELPVAPDNWIKELKWLSELWTPSNFTSDVFKSQCILKIKTVTWEVHSRPDLRPNRKKFGIEGDGFVVLSLADHRSSLERKNIIGSIRAFQGAFPNGEQHKHGARLLIKLRNADKHDQTFQHIKRAADDDGRITIMNEVLNDEDLYTLLKSVDVFLSLHRSEGYGLVMDEAISLGTDVVATEWSGGDSFKKHSKFHGVRSELITVSDTYGPYEFMSGRAKWADPDIEEAAEILRTLADQNNLTRISQIDHDF